MRRKCVGSEVAASVLVACLVTTVAFARMTDSVTGPMHLTSMTEYRDNVISTTTPMVIVLYDRNDTAKVHQVWHPFLREFSIAMHGYGIGVAEVWLGTTVANEMQRSYRLPNAPGILLFNGIHEPVPGHEAALTKTPLAYTGGFKVVEIMRWVLASLSFEAIDRIEKEADLADFFAKFARYPALPHILYLTAADLVGPLYRVLSHELHADAAFGVVVAAMSTPGKRGLAARYGVNATSQLPALLVLHRQANSTLDEVHPMKNLSANTTLSAMEDFLLSELPESSRRVLDEARRTGDVQPLAAMQERKMYIVHELASARAAWESDRTTTSPATKSEPTLTSPTARLVTTEAEWRQSCVQASKGHYCLIAFAESDTQGRHNAVELMTATIAALWTRLPNTQHRLWHALVLDAAQARDVMNYFDAGASGLPDVVLLVKASPNKLYNYVGVFAADAIADFCYRKTAAGGAASGGRVIVARRIPALQELVDMTLKTDRGTADL